MASALSRLLIISLISLFGVFLALLSLRLLGLSHRHVSLDHPLLKNNTLIVAEAGGKNEAPAHTRLAFAKALAASPDILLEMDLRRSQDGHWLAFESPELSSQTGYQGLVRELTLAQIKELDAGFNFQSAEGTYPYRNQGLKILTLQEVLESFPQARGFVLDIHEHDVSALDQLLKILSAFDLKDRLIISSPMAKSLRHLRSKKPRWLFAASPGDLAQAQILNGIFLETLAPLNADIVFSPLGQKQMPFRLLMEIQRRHQKLIAVTDNPAQISGEEAEFIDGFLTTRPSFTIRQLNQLK